MGQTMAPYLWAMLAAVVIGVPGALALLGRAGGAHWRIAPVRRLMGLLLVIIALLLGVLSWGIHRYAQLFSDRPVAVLEMREQSPQLYRVTVLRVGEAGGEPQQEFLVRGDGWRMEATVLRWQVPAALAGLPTLYRLERLGGRYDDLNQERDGPHSVFDLSGSGGPWDITTLQRRYARWVPFLEVGYGSATWMPMFDHARYLVQMNERGGLLAQPADARTETGLRRLGWPGS